MMHEKLSDGGKEKKNCTGNWQFLRELNWLRVLGFGGNEFNTHTLRNWHIHGKKNIDLAIEQHDLSNFFVGAACSEDVKNGKPDPEVLKAAGILSRNLGNVLSLRIVRMA